MKPRLQLSVRNALIAMTWAAVWLANWALAQQRYYSLGFGELAFVTFMVMPPAALVGAIAGRPLLGFLCGAASAAALVAWLALVPNVLR
jgi:hypothetical protein